VTAHGLAEQQDTRPGKSTRLWQKQAIQGHRDYFKTKDADKSLLFLNNVPVFWEDEINEDVISHF
jgi:hypothetical protein